ncbi:MAG: hypothetical protein V1793_16965 [Pseudomonadota bacterium]
MKLRLISALIICLTPLFFSWTSVCHAISPYDFGNWSKIQKHQNGLETRLPKSTAKAEARKQTLTRTGQTDLVIEKMPNGTIVISSSLKERRVRPAVTVVEQQTARQTITPAVSEMAMVYDRQAD